MPSGALDGVSLRLVKTLDDALELKRWAAQRRDGPLAFDTESGGLSPHHHRLRLIQLGDMRTGWAVPYEQWSGVALEILQGYPGELLAHNSPYDWRVLAVQAGAKPRWERTHDSLIGGHLVDSVKLAGLKPRAAADIDSRAIRGEAVLKEGMAAQHWTWDTVPLDWEPFWAYGALDPVLAAHLWDRFCPQVTGEFGRSYDLERATLRICAEMMMAGMKIDVPFIQSKIAAIDRYLEQALPWLQREYGIETVNSNEQVGQALNRAGVPTLVYTDGGAPSISKDTLKFYRSQFPDAAELIQAITWCRKAEAIRGRYLQKFLDMRVSGDIMHYTIWTSRARTGRMSVTDPPMQTFDRDEPVIRGAFIPRPGHVFISIDADQIEARMAAHLSGDQRMIADFLAADEAGIGFFLIMSSKIYNEQVTKKDPRYNWTKNATYGQIYGASLEKAAATAGIPVDQMRPAYSGFQQQYPGVAALMTRLIREGKYGGKRPQVRTLSGRRLYADRGHEYALLNYLIQGSAAEIMKQGQVDLVAAGYGPYLRLDIHDEILAEVPAEHAQEALHGMEEILTNRTDFSVPITWSGNILTERWVKT